MSRIIFSLVALVSLTGTVLADVKLPAATSVAKVLPYVQTIHQVLDTLTSRESPTVVHVKKVAADAPSEWIVHRVRAEVWVERSATNYLGEVGVKVSIPCQIEFGLDLTLL